MVQRQSPPRAAAALAGGLGQRNDHRAHAGHLRRSEGPKWNDATEEKAIIYIQ